MELVLVTDRYHWLEQQTQWIENPPNFNPFIIPMHTYPICHLAKKHIH